MPRTAIAIRRLMGMSLIAAAPLRAQSAHPPLHVHPSFKDCSVKFAPELTQSAYDRFVREFGSVSAFKQMASSHTLGKGRVLVGVEMLSFRIDDGSPAWNDTFHHPSDHHPLGATQQFPKLKLRAGVTDDLDVGAFYTKNFSANYGWLGVDGKYALRKESAERPVSVAVRGAYTKTLYVSDMDMHALTADVSVGRRLWRVVRPYAALGADGVLARETSDAVNLRDRAIIVPHLVGGIEATVWRHLSVGAEFTLGARPTTQVQVAGVLF
jgi:hypothetical protein